jgi:N-acetyl-gamma-glutamylphosphate reductase
MCASSEAADAGEHLRSIAIFLPAARWCALRKTLPQIQYSVRTNYADIGFQLAPSGRRAVIVSCLDNLLKGAPRRPCRT